MTWRWPLVAEPLLPDAPGRFGAKRCFDVHTGVDLYCESGAEVVAVEAGRVVGVELFTGPNAASPWWNETQAVLVEGEAGVVVYGEIESKLRHGDKVARGQHVGRVMPVLKKFKGRPMVMLHLELMRHGAYRTLWWHERNQQPVDLLDPTPNLPEAPEFDLATYDGERFRGDV